MRRLQNSIVGFGILLPYLARLPGVPFKGIGWLTSFFPHGRALHFEPGAAIAGVLFMAAFNALSWGTVLFAVRSFKDNPQFAWFPIVFGFPLPLAVYLTLDLGASSTASLALVFGPIWSVPLTLLGWGVGKMLERAARNQARTSEASITLPE